jgi:hypothetical protein
VLEHAGIFVMRADPKLENCVTVEQTERTVILSDANRIYGATVANMFEIQTMCIRIDTPEIVRLISTVLYFFWQSIVQFPELRGRN